MHCDLAGFHFGPSPADRKLVNQLAACEFMRAAHNVVVGSLG